MEEERDWYSLLSKATDHLLYLSLSLYKSKAVKGCSQHSAEK